MAHNRNGEKRSGQDSIPSLQKASTPAQPDKGTTHKAEQRQHQSGEGERERITSPHARILPGIGHADWHAVVPRINMPDEYLEQHASQGETKGTSGHVQGNARFLFLSSAHNLVLDCPVYHL